MLLLPFDVILRMCAFALGVRCPLLHFVGRDGQLLGYGFLCLFLFAIFC